MKNNNKLIRMDTKVTSIGVDGCRGGWIAAVLKQGDLMINKYLSVSEIVKEYPEFDGFFIDMIIGLAGNKEHVRPEAEARKLIRERSSTLFPAPCRQAVYSESVAKAYEENERVLGKKFTPLTVGIIPKMRELDMFLQENPRYKNVIRESHPEICFGRLNNSTVLTKKSEQEGMRERINILSDFIKELDLDKITGLSKSFRCNADDVLDAVCLCVSANIVSQGKYQEVPEHPMTDDTGLLMQMIIPKCFE